MKKSTKGFIVGGLVGLVGLITSCGGTGGNIQPIPKKASTEQMIDINENWHKDNGHVYNKDVPVYIPGEGQFTADTRTSIITSDNAGNPIAKDEWYTVIDPNANYSNNELMDKVRLSVIGETYVNNPITGKDATQTIYEHNDSVLEAIRAKYQ